MTKDQLILAIEELLEKAYLGNMSEFDIEDSMDTAWDEFSYEYLDEMDDDVEEALS